MRLCEAISYSILNIASNLQRGFRRVIPQITELVEKEIPVHKLLIDTFLRIRISTDCCIIKGNLTVEQFFPTH